MTIAIEAQRIFRPNKHGMDFVALETIRELIERLADSIKQRSSPGATITKYLLSSFLFCNSRIVSKATKSIPCLLGRKMR